MASSTDYYFCFFFKEPAHLLFLVAGQTSVNNAASDPLVLQVGRQSQYRLFENTIGGIALFKSFLMNEAFLQSQPGISLMTDDLIRISASFDHLNNNIFRFRAIHRWISSAEALKSLWSSCDLCMDLATIWHSSTTATSKYSCSFTISTVHA